MLAPVFYINKCTKDKGTLLYLSDSEGEHLQCLNCGNYYEDSSSLFGKLVSTRGNIPQENLTTVNGKSDPMENEFRDDMLKVAHEVRTAGQPLKARDILATQLGQIYVEQAFGILASTGYINVIDNTKIINKLYDAEPEQRDLLGKIELEYRGSIDYFSAQSPMKNGTSEDSLHEILIDERWDLTNFGQFALQNASGDHNYLQQFLENFFEHIQSQRKKYLKS